MPQNKRGEFAHSKATTILTAKFQNQNSVKYSIFSKTLNFHFVQYDLVKVNKNNNCQSQPCFCYYKHKKQN